MYAGLAGFYLVQRLGLESSLQMTALVNVLIGFTAVALARRRGDVETAGRDPAPGPQTEAGRGFLTATFRGACLLVALTGGVSMGLEVLAARSLVLIFGASLQAFAIVLMAFILGIGLGGAVVALVVMSYVFFGGMRGTAWVNTFQTTLFLAFGAIAVAVIAAGMGGFRAAAEGLLASPGTAPLLTRERVSPLYFFSYSFIPLSSIAFPHIAIFCLTARRMVHFRRTVVLYPLCILAIWLPCVFLGVAANSLRDTPRIAHKLEARQSLATAPATVPMKKGVSSDEIPKIRVAGPRQGPGPPIPVASVTPPPEPPQPPRSAPGRAPAPGPDGRP